MSIPAEDHDSVGAGLAEEVVKAIPFVGKVAPAFPSMLVRNDLYAGCQDTQRRRFPKFFFKPVPLGFPENC